VLTETIGPILARKLTADDLPGLVILEKSTEKEPWTVDNFLGEFERPFFLPLGLFINNELAAFLFAWLLPPETHLLKLTVSPRFQGFGLGAGLISILVDLTRRSRGEKILLEVLQTNQKAVTLYRKAGFTIDGRAKNYYLAGDALFMSLMIDDFPAYRPKDGVIWENVS
jgi:ribosomal protein S18 acetylase RimI-like enzyme